jgi:murein DD-endopeptidase MepM/ murein hydrolase activator NlpD
MDRRGFLKYAGATAAVVGASALGLNYISQQSPSTAMPTPSTTSTARELTTTSAIVSTSSGSSTEAIQLAHLQGRLFFDYNGNGIQDGEEPPVVGASVQLRDYAGSITAEALTDTSGDYAIEDVRTGSYKLHVEGEKKFRYMCTSPGEFRAVSDGYAISLQESTKFNIGLMEGFLTLPFPKDIPIYVDGSDFFDHDPGPDALWWDGTRRTAPRPHRPEYAHPETDFYMPKGTEVKATAAGTVNGIKTESSGVQWISLTHSYGYGTTYLHIEKPMVPVAAFVNRGDTIALSGNTGAGEDNFHTAFQIWRHMPDGYDYCIDPYSPVAGVAKGAWIAGTWKWYPSDEAWISQGYWTKLNDPQYPSI